MVYLSAAVVGGLLVTASVVAELWLTPALPTPTRSAPPTANQLLSCNRDVSRLLDQLGDAAGGLIAVPASTQPAQPVATRWAQFTRQWRRDWAQVGARCRFGEGGSGMGVGHDRMARVHDNIQAVQLRYDELVRRFDNEQVDDLIGMRRALAKSRKSLERRVR
ncbi:MAG: hypothetical protein KJO07_12265 [Deltaproteobacteria bacterium]|jgi:hypothetical protein|nr:hypothetical protein [Deltaproteobacteria bacterium]